VSWATANERVVVVLLQRLYLRRVLVLVPVVVSDGGVVGGEGGT
jgi:hypothetical protein